MAGGILTPSYRVRVSVESVDLDFDFDLDLDDSSLEWDLDRALRVYCSQDTHPFNGPLSGTTRASRYQKGRLQEAQLSPSDRAMLLVSSNLANYHTSVQKLLIRQVLTKLMV